MSERLLARLTKREIEVLYMVFKGKTNKQVANDLRVSHRTVDFHLGRAYGKLGVGSRWEAYHLLAPAFASL